MARILIYSASYLLLVTDDALEDEGISKKTYIFNKDVCENGDEFKWISAREGLYDTNKDNIGKCATCGCWTTDLEADNPIDALQRGARIDGIVNCVRVPTLSKQFVSQGVQAGYNQPPLVVGD